MTALLERPAPAPPELTGRRSRSSRLRPAARMAWRDVRHAPGRSALVVLLIALPIFALSAADVLVHTMQLSSYEQVTRRIGSAQAEIPGPPTIQTSPIEQSPDGQSSFGTSTPARKGQSPAPITPNYLLAHLPPGSRLLTTLTGDWTITTRYGITTTAVSDAAYAGPLLARLTTQVAGRRPTRPGEVALSFDLAAKIGRSVGQSIVDTSTGLSYTIVGLIKARYDRTAQLAYVAPGTLTGAVAAPGSVQRSYFVASAAPVTWPMILTLNRVGVTVLSRSVAAHPPARNEVPYYSSGNQAAMSSSGLTTAALLAGMVVLEIVLLAGPAFTVGARRMGRTLGLIGAVGGSRRDLRNVVLAGGVLLGLAAGVVGILLGVAAGFLLVPAYAHWRDQVPGPFDVRPIELGALVAVSILTGLLAAWLPARHAARTDILASLRGRRGTIRTTRVVPIAGSVLAAAGAVIAIGGSATTGNRSVLLAGIILAELGVIACTPALIEVAGRAARWLPLAGRIALRDTVRNRSASASAVAAIMAAVTGAVATSILVASIDQRDRAAYQQSLPMHYGYVDLEDGGRLSGGTTSADVVTAVRTAVPGHTVVLVHGARMTFADNSPVTSAAPVVHRTSVVTYGGAVNWPTLIADDGTAIAAITGHPTPAGVAALRAGKAVVFNRALLDHGLLTVLESTMSPDGRTSRSARHRIAAVLVASSYRRFDAVIPPRAMAAWRLPVATSGVLVAGTTALTGRQQQAAQAALARLDIPGGLTVENGYQPQYRVGLLALLGASGFIALAAALIATMLATVDSRPDLQTLGAIGASPRVRRRLSAARAAVTAGLGCGLGVACGLVAALGYIGTQNTVSARAHSLARLPFAIPWWPDILGMLIVLPLLATAGGFLFSRSRLPSERARAT